MAASTALTILRCYWPQRNEDPGARAIIRLAIANERLRRSVGLAPLGPRH